MRHKENGKFLFNSLLGVFERSTDQLETVRTHVVKHTVVSDNRTSENPSISVNAVVDS